MSDSSFLMKKTAHKLPGRRLIAIECPLQVSASRNSSAASDKYERLIERLGGKSKLFTQLTEKDHNKPVELRLGNAKNDFIHPIPGEWVQTSNVLIKVIKRTRVIKTIDRSNEISTEKREVVRKIFKIEPVGTIETTVRFRALGDFQFIPNLRHPINLLARDMKNLNPEGVLQFNFQPESDENLKNIETFPPPIFSRYLVPQLYQFKSNLSSRIVENPDGSKRLINRSRYSGTLPQSIHFDHPQVPQGPLEENSEIKGPGHDSLHRKTLSLFEQRPMWTRLAFQNQLTHIELRALRHNKHFLASVCYMFSDGVFRDLLIRFGYDPRIVPEARFYQRVSIRNLDNKDRQEKFTFKLMRGSSTRDHNQVSQPNHIFDGLNLNQSVGTYQLCDITDPLLANLIKSEKGVLPHCRVRDGWYTSNAIEQIRSILRRKFHSLLSKVVIRHTECLDLLEIDVRPEAPDLLKKVSKGQERLGGKNVSFHGPNLLLEDGPNTENNHQNISTSKSSSLHNPLLRPYNKKRRSRAQFSKRNSSLEDDILQVSPAESLIQEMNSATLEDQSSGSELSVMSDLSSISDQEDEDYEVEGSEEGSEDDGDEDFDENVNKRSDLKGKHKQIDDSSGDDDVEMKDGGNEEGLGSDLSELTSPSESN